MTKKTKTPTKPGSRKSGRFPLTSSFVKGFAVGIVLTVVGIIIYSKFSSAAIKYPPQNSNGTKSYCKVACKIRWSEDDKQKCEAGCFACYDPCFTAGDDCLSKCPAGVNDCSQSCSSIEDSCMDQCHF